MVEVLILSFNENAVLRDEEGRARNTAGQLIHTHGAVIHDALAVAERDDFELKPIYITLMGQRPFHDLTHNQSMAHNNIFEELVSFIFNGVSEDHYFYKFFPYSLAGNATHWFKKLPP